MKSMREQVWAGKWWVLLAVVLGAAYTGVMTWWLGPVGTFVGIAASAWFGCKVGKYIAWL